MNNEPSISADQLREWMRAHNVSNAELATLVYSSQRAVGFWLAGPAAKRFTPIPPGLFELARLKTALRARGFDVDNLLAAQAPRIAENDSVYADCCGASHQSD